MHDEVKFEKSIDDTIKELSGFSQAAIKDAITNEESTEEKERSFKTIELENNWERKEQEPNKLEFDNLKIESALPAPPPVSVNNKQKFQKQDSKNSEIFVKIDKFYSAKKALESTKSKLNEIDELLKRIREVKIREEQELSSWEKDIVNLKSKIKDVHENIFEKIE